MPSTAKARSKSTARSKSARRVSGSRGGRIRRFLLRALGLLLLVTAAFWILCCCGLVLLKWINPITTSVQLQRRIEALLAHRPYHKQFDFVPLYRISPNLQHAAIAAEDARFYQHHGIDWQAVDTVVHDSLEEGEVTRGASTI